MAQGKSACARGVGIKFPLFFCGRRDGLCEWCDDERTVAVGAQTANECIENRRHVGLQRERWIDHQEAGAIEERRIARWTQIEFDRERGRNFGFGGGFRHGAFETCDGLWIFDRIPEQYCAGCEAFERVGQAFGHADQFARFFEGRIDE